MDSFRELQEIYEGYRGHSEQPASQSYPATQGKHSYKGPVPGQTPGGQGPIMVNTPMHSDEESHTDMSSFMRQDILKKIETLIKDAERFDDTKTLFALNDLRVFVKNL